MKPHAKNWQKPMHKFSSTNQPIKDPLVPYPPEPLAKREVCVAMNVPNTIRMPDDPRPPDPKRWFKQGLVDGTGSCLEVRDGNEVMYLIDGPQTFKAMVEAIKTAKDPGKHFIYSLGLWLSDDYKLIPGYASSTVRSLLTVASRLGVQVRAMLWDQWLIKNNREVESINKLDHGAAILDNCHLARDSGGSHHQKILIVNGSEDLIAFCGGIDINPDRLHAPGVSRNKDGGTIGTPRFPRGAGDVL